MSYQAAALFMGNCTGHGEGTGGSWHPGPGGGTITPCPHSPKHENIVHKPMAEHLIYGSWKPTPQTPLKKPIVTNVVINGKVPIVDQDLLSPHPTVVQYATTSTGDKCYTTLNTPAYHCHTYTGIGNVGGREPEVGHVRKCFATTKTVFINKVRAGRFADPLGDKSTAFPCLSLISGASPDVYIGI